MKARPESDAAFGVPETHGTPALHRCSARRRQGRRSRSDQQRRLPARRTPGNWSWASTAHADQPQAKRPFPGPQRPGKLNPEGLGRSSPPGVKMQASWLAAPRGRGPKGRSARIPGQMLQLRPSHSQTNPGAQDGGSPGPPHAPSVGLTPGRSSGVLG